MKSYYAIALLAVALLASGLELRYQLAQKQTLKADLKRSKTQLKAQDKLVTDIKVQLEKIHSIDTQIVEELAHANKSISRLKRDVYAGNKRLRVNATCPKPMPYKPATLGVVNERACELNRDARQDYFNLRAALESARLKIKGLQSYIKALPAQCVQGNDKGHKSD